MWDLVTLQKRNNDEYCAWLAKRITEVLLGARIPVSLEVKERVNEFVRSLPQHKECPSIY